MENLKLVLASAGCSLERVVFARVYLTNFDRDYDPMNGVYQSYFAPGRPPARTCIGVTGLAWVHSSRPICWHTRKAERAPPQAAPPSEAALASFQIPRPKLRGETRCRALWSGLQLALCFHIKDGFGHRSITHHYPSNS
jgi:enamine deaminase RidA (YjgF/YER057c/UK114 family)